jgi:predicted nucleic acid-binding protein
MLYLDTSLLVSAFTIEARTAQIQDWLSSQEPDDLTISDWVITEFSSALSLKIRTGQIDLAQRNTALSYVLHRAMESMDVLAVSPTHFRAAASYADQHELGLGAADALHLAIAMDHGAALCTLDRTQAAAGTTLGAKTVLV